MYTYVVTYIKHVYRVFMCYNANIHVYIIMLLPCKGVAQFIMVYNPLAQIVTN